MADRNVVINAIKLVAEECDESREQQAIKGCLLALLGAVHEGSHLELLNHMGEFSRNAVRRLSATRN
jgi:hypothetical protein